MSEHKDRSVMSPIWSKVLLWSPRVMAVLALPIVMGHAYWAFVADCAVHFSRGGSLLVIMAVFSVFGLEDRMHRTSHLIFLSGKDDVPIPFRFLGPYIVAGWLAIIGTMIWGYGDLIINHFRVSNEGCYIAG